MLTFDFDSILTSLGRTDPITITQRKLREHRRRMMLATIQAGLPAMVRSIRNASTPPGALPCRTPSECAMGQIWAQEDDRARGEFCLKKRLKNGLFPGPAG
jgi:hypothetical protein